MRLFLVGTIGLGQFIHILNQEEVVTAMHVDHGRLGSEFFQVRLQCLEKLMGENFGDHDALNLDLFVELIFVDHILFL